ncbi:MAG: aminopeptidase P family protein [Planctomycetes bacterium]|nr:aminopeptidase P family protein [Planctomycetota bacterium]
MRLPVAFVSLALLLAGASRTWAHLPPGELREACARRRAALASSLPEGAAVLVRGAAWDERLPFRQTSDLHYLTGLDEPDVALVLTHERSTLFLPAADPVRGLWDGPRLAAGPATAEAFGLEEALPLDRLVEALAGLRRTGGTLYDSGPEPGPAGARPAGPLIAALRQVKDPLELARLRRAVEATRLGLVEAMRLAAPGVREDELAALLEYCFRRGGAQGTGFPSIVASGPNSCVLHHRASERPLEGGDLVILDVGAEVDRYTADVTRTIPASGRFGERQREVYELVLAAQAAGIAAVRPGATLAEVHRAALRVIEEAGQAGRFPHGTSHWLGLDVHDVGTEARLAPGMVLTVEPGVYLREEALGVRIEDDVLVTSTGSEVLSRAIPRAVEAIEALMAERGLGEFRPGKPLDASPAAPAPPRPWR